MSSKHKNFFIAEVDFSQKKGCFVIDSFQDIWLQYYDRHISNNVRSKVVLNISKSSDVRRTKAKEYSKDDCLSWKLSFPNMPRTLVETWRQKGTTKNRASSDSLFDEENSRLRLRKRLLSFWTSFNILVNERLSIFWNSNI